MQQGIYYSNAELLPLRGRAEETGVQMSSNLRGVRGQALAQVLAAAVSAVQTLSSTATATSGSFTIEFNGNYTALLPYGATAAQVQAALQALPNIGPGNITCTGGALPGVSIVLTFAGELANLPQNLMNVRNSTIAGNAAVYSIASTTAGIGYRRWVPYDGTLIAPPAAAPTVAGNGAGSGFGAGGYAVQTTYVTASGETTPSPAAFVTLTAGQNIRVSAIANLDSAITAVRYYVNGVLSASTAPAAGTAAQTDITGTAIALAGSPPRKNGAFKYSDGRATVRGFARYDFVTDERGGISLGTASVSQFGAMARDMGVYVGGLFNYSDLVGMDQAAIETLGARFIRGSMTSGNAEILIPY